MTTQTIPILKPLASAGRPAWYRHVRWAAPLMLFVVGGIMLLSSIHEPYWRMKMLAPQYPKGLIVNAYLTHLEGDVRELDELNHYIGMLPLEKGGTLERSSAPAMLIGVSVLLVLAAFVRTRWTILLALPVLLFPVVFLLDLQGWLSYFGNHLDPHAALSSSIKPFTPKVLGVGLIGQFKTIAVAGPGFWRAVDAATVVAVGLVVHGVVRRFVKSGTEAGA